VDEACVSRVAGFTTHSTASPATGVCVCVFVPTNLSLGTFPLTIFGANRKPFLSVGHNPGAPLNYKNGSVTRMCSGWRANRGTEHLDVIHMIPAHTHTIGRPGLHISTPFHVCMCRCRQKTLDEHVTCTRPDCGNGTKLPVTFW
jgi:hypothetical protein